MDNRLPQIDELTTAILRLAENLNVVEAEDVPIANCLGRVLAEPLLADRDSPPCDVSAMDGYAIRLADLAGLPLPVPHTAVAGAAPHPLRPGTAIKIFTGAPVPFGADTVIAREQCVESPTSVLIEQPAESVKKGEHIRYRGENIAASSQVLSPGSEINSTSIAAAATFGRSSLRVYRRVRVAIVNTGDELVPPGEPAESWQIRDSNGPLLASWLVGKPWVELISRTRVQDDLNVLRDHLRSLLVDCDAIVVTGGVSAGDTDHVPHAVASLGGTQVFHRLGIRPGKPVFGAHLDNKLILGLPGNPTSTAVTSRVFGDPLLARLGGKLESELKPLVELIDADNKQLHLIWFRLVSMDQRGRVRLLPNLGSGDVVALARSVGFVTVPAGASGSGPWQFTRW